MHTEYITIDPSVCHGKPVIKGTRILVSNILSQLAGGYSFEQIKKGYPELTDEQIAAAIEYAVQVIDQEDVILISA